MIHDLLTEGRRSKTNKTKTLATWATKELRKLKNQAWWVEFVRNSDIWCIDTLCSCVCVYITSLCILFFLDHSGWVKLTTHWKSPTFFEKKNYIPEARSVSGYWMFESERVTDWVKLQTYHMDKRDHSSAVRRENFLGERGREPAHQLRGARACGSSLILCLLAPLPCGQGRAGVTGVTLFYSSLLHLAFSFFFFFCSPMPLAVWRYTAVVCCCIAYLL